MLDSNCQLDPSTFKRKWLQNSRPVSPRLNASYEVITCFSSEFSSSALWVFSRILDPRQRFHGVLLVLVPMRYHEIPLGSTSLAPMFCRVPQGSPGFPRVPQGSPGFPRVPQGSPGFPRAQVAGAGTAMNVSGWPSSPSSPSSHAVTAKDVSCRRLRRSGEATGRWSIEKQIEFSIDISHHFPTSCCCSNFFSAVAGPLGVLPSPLGRASRRLVDLGLLGRRLGRMGELGLGAAQFKEEAGKMGFGHVGHVHQH